MKLLFAFVLLSHFAFSQDRPKATGIVGNGVYYTHQFEDIKTDEPLSELDTVKSEFRVVISETQKFISLFGILDIDSTFAFDTMRIENLFENEYLTRALTRSNFTQRNDIHFEVDYIKQIVQGGYHPLIVKWVYDDAWNSVKLYASFTQNGVNHFYNFYFDEVTYLGWKHELTYSKTFNFDSYGETNTQSKEEVEVFKETNDGTIVINDTALLINCGKINLDKIVTRSFSSETKNLHMVNGAMISIPKNGKWIFYSFNFDKTKGAFEGYYYFGIREEE